MKLILTPVKKRLLIWTLIMLPFVITDSVLMAYGRLNRTWGGVVFIALMIILVYGNYLITRKPKEVKNGL